MVIINRSMVLGRPLAMMMLSVHKSMICHSKTENLELTRAADVVCAGGRARQALVRVFQ